VEKEKSKNHLIILLKVKSRNWDLGFGEKAES
jgi:hypothetical protein